jgi:hypothetical protein
MHSRLQAPSPKSVFFCLGCQPTLDGHNVSTPPSQSYSHSSLSPASLSPCVSLFRCLCLCAPPSYLKRPYTPSPPRASRYRDLMLCVIFASRQNLRIIGEIQVTLRPLTLERRGCHWGLSRQPACRQVLARSRPPHPTPKIRARPFPRTPPHSPSTPSPSPSRRDLCRLLSPGRCGDWG